MRTRRILALAPFVALVAYAAAIRPRLLTWGSTPEERTGHLPGDDMVDRPRYQTTHAITVGAPPHDVWPWLAQIGQGRAGFYSYDWLENLAGCDIHSADRIHEGWQQLRRGDPVRLVPEGTEPDLSYEVLLADPNRALILVTPGTPHGNFERGLPFGTWSFVLEHGQEPGTTRLIVRLRSDFRPTLASVAMFRFGLEPVHWLMERKMLAGIRQRAEREARHPMLAQHPHVVT